jgi:hypothetical protein
MGLGVRNTDRAAAMRLLERPLLNPFGILGLSDLEISQCMYPLTMELFFSAGPVGLWSKADSKTARPFRQRIDKKGVSPLLACWLALVGLFIYMFSLSHSFL